MLLFLNQISKIKFFFSILFAFLPISFIAGNTIINTNIILIILSSILIFKKDLFKLELIFVDKCIFLFFGLILFTGFYNDIYFIISDAFPTGYHTILKSIFFFKYLLLYLTLKFLIKKNIINFKYFFTSCFFCSTFVCFDIFYQFKFGKDIFGFETLGSGRRLSGPFGDEEIAGGYLQRFALFSFFLVPLYYKKISNKLSALFIPILFLIFISGIILSGNRMPFIIFIFLISLVIFFQKQTRKFILPFIIVCPMIFSLIYFSNQEVKNNFDNFYKQVSKMIVIISSKDFENKNSPQYIKEFGTFYDTWLLNKYIGGGIKNFRYYCHVRKITNEKKSTFICNMHPHNYYLEILTETGLLGLIIILVIFFQIFYITFYKKYFLISKLNNNNTIIPFIFLFIAEIFPIKSTGSFFTTGNTTYLFLIISVLIGLSLKENSIENKH